MTKLPTLAEARAAYDATVAAFNVADAEADAALNKKSAARRAFLAAKRGLEEARERDEKNAVARDRRKAQALAEQYGITLEREDFGERNIQYFVLGPKALYGGGYGAEAAAEKGVRADPCDGDHYCGSWSEVLHNVGIYVADMEAWGGDIAAKLTEAPRD